MKRSNFKKYVLSFSGVAIILVGLLIVLPILIRDQQELSLQNEGGSKQPIDEEMAAGGDINEEAAVGEDICGTIPLTNLIIETDYRKPSSLYIGKQYSVRFSEEDKETIIKNLTEHGWNNVTGKLTYFDSKNQSMLNFFQPETYDDSNDGKKDESNFAATEKHIQFAQKFLEDSGIVKLLQGYNIELSNKPSDETFATVFYAYFEGFRTETYLRVQFSPDGTLEDAQLYAVELEKANNTHNVLSLEEAIKNAFYSSESTNIGDDEYLITGVNVIYKSGFPFYELKLKSNKNNMVMDGYALAVDYNEIKDDKELSIAFESLKQKSIW